MLKQRLLLIFSSTAFAISVVTQAQTPAGNVSAGQFGSTTGGGTYTFPGNVGIGTLNPQALLDIQSPADGITSLLLSQQNCVTCGWSVSANNDGTFRLFRSDNPSSLLSMLYNNGYVGIGTATPTQALSVNGSISTGGPGSGLFFRTPPVGQFNTTLSSSLLYEGLISGNGTAATPWGLNLMTVPWTWGGDPMTFHAGTYWWRLNNNGSGPETTAMTLNPSGNLGIGTTSPSATLEVNGTAKVDGTLSIGNGGIYFPGNATPQTQPYTGVTCGGDYAESVDVTGSRTNYEPGDVLVIDPNALGKFLKSTEPYSTAVLGVYSTKPGMVGRRQTTPKNPEEVPMAMVGIVPTKLSAENGAIKPGDLLVTASTPGYAMKGTDRSRMLGAVIGKALGGLDTGRAVIEVGVTLQ